MKSQRQLQIGENIKRIMSEIFLRDDFSVMMNNVITVLEADVSPDAKNVKIYIDIFGDTTKQDKIFEKITEKTLYFRHELAKKIDLSFIPEIVFIHDKTFEKANLIDEILNNQILLDKKPKKTGNKKPRK